MLKGFSPTHAISSSITLSLEILLKASMPNAFHDSGARYPPPKCHHATRKDYIAKITEWAQGKSDHSEPILWMRGPFGVGKTAVAQSSAEALESLDKLLATLFFSRSYADRDDPQRFIPSIAYQIATKCPSFEKIVSARILRDPALATKSLSKQFDELLVHPLQEIDVARNGLNGCVIIIDGLDECRGSDAQCEIIRVIATSAQSRTTPFRWFITSRPEDPIIRTMNSDVVSPVLYHFELPVSREIDHEILVYLTDEFDKIRKHQDLPESWPSEEVLALFVERASGLWIYAATIIRFIKDENSLGPEDQLQIFIEFAEDVTAKVGLNNPLAEMDCFYAFIVRRVPPNALTILRKILILCIVHNQLRTTNYISLLLRLPLNQVNRICGFIQSVVSVDPETDYSRLRFYHASFLDFMKDPARSNELCIYGNLLAEVRRTYLGWLHEMCSSTKDISNQPLPAGIILREDEDWSDFYSYTLLLFWSLCDSTPGCPLDTLTVASLKDVPFRRMLEMHRNGWTIDGAEIRRNLPADLRDKIVRRDRCPVIGCTRTEDVWILGWGENEAVPYTDPTDEHRDRFLKLYKPWSLRYLTNVPAEVNLQKCWKKAEKSSG
ncbi:hypothetical protein NP233_g9396 [Leucocoprinus birnbaumii]|uniref:Nephrocystin 3-like N-terminal domain-containing protein n=1 Tax=Leucocoprinus birnbaumii TaxID=56174 RepID=A0AAD5VMT7_9AGAR|nr:hypothetical protein NP233_g9396 [Leucocoprinus birnbaumii]